MTELIYKKEAYDIISCAMEVHRELGPGFSEAVYQEALEIEFKLRNIDFYREKELNVFYKGIQLEKKFIADFICYDKIVVELKALSDLTGEHESQVINYLKATKHKLGILINFGAPSLEFKRLINFPD